MKLSAENRPLAFTSWLRGKKLITASSPIDLIAFSAAFRAWWRANMPSWRLTELGWPLSRSPPAGETWDCVKKPGVQGSFLFVVALFWWRTAISDASQSMKNEYESALEDVAWVLWGTCTMGDL